MTAQEEIKMLYEKMLSYMITKDTASLGKLLAENSVLIRR